MHYWECRGVALALPCAVSERPPALQAQILQAFKHIHGFQQLVLDMASFVFKARLHEVARAHLRDAFLLAQRPLTDAVIAIFKKTSGAEWASKLKSYVGQSMKDHVADDGRAFDMCVRLRCSDALF